MKSLESTKIIFKKLQLNFLSEWNGMELTLYEFHLLTPRTMHANMYTMFIRS